MVDAARHAARRGRLRQRVEGPILLLGNGTRSRNLPMGPLPFRQDSTFLYFTGCALPNAAALLDDDGMTLFLESHGPDDALWHGLTPGLEELGARYGADRVRDAGDLAEAAQLHSGAHVLAVADEQRNRAAEGWLGRPLRFGAEHGSEALVDAVIDLRRRKDAWEIEQITEAARITAVAHRAAMAATHPGGHERALAAWFDAVLALHDCVTGYDTILTQAGEVLHNFRHDTPLQGGRLVLLDGGAELRSGYGADLTRTWPVSGRFTARQRAAYDAVLEAQEASIALCTPGTRYRAVHDASSSVLAQFLADEGLLRCSAEVAVETGAHALFFPHGVGHHLGLDVHDLENFGDRPSYAPGASRPDQFGTCNLRLDLPLEPGWVVTVEPGFYVVPQILEAPELRARFAEHVDFDRAASWLGFGGIRIEDDVHVTDQGPSLCSALVRAAEDIEALVGTRPGPEELLCGP